MLDQPDALYAHMVMRLEALGATSAYSQDASEADPRYLSYGVRMPQVKGVFAEVKAGLKPLGMGERLALATRLITSGYGEQQTLGLFILQPLAKDLGPKDLPLIAHLFDQLRGWSKIDAFTGAFLQRILIAHRSRVLPMVAAWGASDNMWLRRASVTVFTRKLAQSGVEIDFALGQCERLAFDRERLVLTGVGWSLKDYMRFDRDRIGRYVRRLRDRGVSSTVTLYAVRDLRRPARERVLKGEAPNL